MTYAVFKITDGTIAGTVDFLGSIFYMVDWRPSIPDFKNGGSFIDPPTASGRRLAFFTYENAVEPIKFRMRADDGDTSNQQLSKLAQLMDKAARHWTTNGSVDPVWLEVKSPREASVKYSKIMFGRLSGMSNPFTQPYIQNNCTTVIEEDLTLIIERGPWQDSAPGTSSSIPMTGTQFSENVIINPSFEYDYGGWRLIDGNVEDTQTTAEAYHGNYSMKLTGVTGGGGTYQEFYVPGYGSGDSVTCTVWAKVESGTAELNVYDGGGFTNAASDTTTSSNWTQLSVSKTVPASEYIRFSIEVSAIGGVAYFDLCEVSFTWGKSPAVTTDPAYVANTRSQNPLSHIFVDDGTVFGNNLLTQSLPYNLLPASPQVGDAVYFGSCMAQTVQAYGPFSNIIFNLASGADVTLDWEYYDYGTSGWETLGVQDNTLALSQTGESNLSISVPRLWWPTTVNGVEGMWLRGVVSAVGGAGTAQQATFHPFTITDNYVEIPGDQFVGDEAPLVDVDITNIGGTSITDEYYEIADGANDGVWDDNAGGAPYGDTSQSVDTVGQDESMLIRFPAVNIPQGATIVSAKLRINPGSHDFTDAGGYGTFGISVEDSDNSVALSTSQSADSRTWLTPYVEWTLDHYRVGGSWVWISSPNIADHIEEVVGKSTWVSGNAISLRVTDLVVGATDFAQFQMYEEDNWGPFLDVTWAAPKTYVSSVIVGSRKTSRGSDFRSIIPASPYQRDGISVVAQDATVFYTEPGVNGPLHDYAMAARVQIASGTLGQYKDRVTIRIPPDMSNSFTGRFRVFLRAYTGADSAEVDAPSFRLKYGVGGGTAYSQAGGITTYSTPELVDLGSISIPEVGANEDVQEIVLAIQAARNNQLVFWILDLILIPADEWIAEVTSPKTTGGALSLGETVSIKSIGSTGFLTARMINSSSKYVQWFASGRLFKPEPGETVRLWFIATSNETLTGQSAATRASQSNLTFEVSSRILNTFNIYPG